MRPGKHLLPWRYCIAFRRGTKLLRTVAEVRDLLRRVAFVPRALPSRRLGPGYSQRCTTDRVPTKASPHLPIGGPHFEVALDHIVLSLFLSR